MPIQIELDTYIKLLAQANRSPLIKEDFTIITNDQALLIQTDKDWQTQVQLVPFSDTDLDQFRQLGLINTGETKWWKMYRIGDWLSAMLNKDKRDAERLAEVKQIGINHNRILDATTKLCQTMKVEPKAARLMMRQYILKGLMPEIAKLLEVEDLVGKPQVEEI